jgi:hypothetical protein
MTNWPMARLIAEMQADAEDPDFQKVDLLPLKGLDAFDDDDEEPCICVDPVTDPDPACEADHGAGSDG